MFNEKERNNLFLRQSCLDSWDEYNNWLDKGASNTCIDQIFACCEDLIGGKFICGAGGGGFLQVILKKNVTKQMLQERLYEVFQDSGVSVWDSRFVL